ncbi:hypothetical protein EI94DRAFT_1579272, partial [Lactarius quietus]
VKVVYKSKVDQKQYIDILYCSPCFHGAEQHDGIIIRTMHGHFFAQLLLILSVSVAHSTYTVCLIQPLDAPIGSQRPKDLELGLHCVRTHRATEFIFSRSIICGVPLIKDFDKEGDFYIMDVADHTGDLFLCCNDIFSV